MLALETGRAYLQALDEVLAAAVAHACRNDPAAAADRWQGLHIDAGTASALARRQGLLAGFHADAGVVATAARADPAFALVARLYHLGDLALAVLVLALAPETDARYGQIFGFLHDDLTRRLATPALAHGLFGLDDDGMRNAVRLLFVPGSPLVDQRIVAVEPLPNETLQTAAVRVDPQIRQLLLDERGVDPRLARFCSLRAASAAAIEDLPIAPALKVALRGAAEALRQEPAIPLRLALIGSRGCFQDQAVEAVAAAAGLPVLTLDVRALLSETGDARALLAIARREGFLANALVHVVNSDALGGDVGGGVHTALEGELPRFGPGIALSVASPAWRAIAGTSGFAPLVFDLPSSDIRLQLWTDCAARRGWILGDSSAQRLATRYRLTAERIEQVAAQAAMTLRIHSTEPPSAGAVLETLLAAAAAQGGHDLEHLAKRVTPRYGWSDIVMTSHVQAQLRELCERVELAPTVLEKWRFSDKLALGRGVSALFAGPSGTGKTMAAEVVASALEIDLFKIDLATVVSKYIGETEKNLDRIFRAAEDVNGILFFDEADALFGKRSEVRDSHDRYANLEISYLLQKMEEFSGIAILATNLQKNLDDAFTRRLAFVVHFPFPDTADRERIWNVVWPDALPRDPNLRFERIAELKLSGGNIKAAALSAAYYAAAERAPVALRHVARAIGREYEKLGKSLKPEELDTLGTGGERT